MNWLVLSHGKSGKREVAISILLFWAFITGRHFFWIDAATHAAQNEAWTTLTYASFAWAAAAFGIDFYMKNRGQTEDRPPPRRPFAADGPESHAGAI